MQAREAAYKAVLASLKEESFIQDSLLQWKEKDKPSSADFHLAQEIANGTARMALALDYLAARASEKGKLRLKLPERVLLRTAIYQHYYMDRVPIYAIVDESVRLAKKSNNPSFAGFLNALLRRLPEISFSLPQGTGVEDLSIRYSYPPFFIEQLLQDYGLEQALNILETLNRSSSTMVRLRTKQPMEGLKPICSDPFPLALVERPELIPQIASSPEYYIQNITPANLIGNLCKQLPSAPQNILDLCSSPGGKLIAVHDFFPQAHLYANDLTPEKLRPMQQNLTKYGIDATLTCSPGQSLELNQTFDVIILDVPCSNTGVLHKRPEARWRLSEESCTELETTQLELIKHAITLLKLHGQLWYLTCSILKRENEQLIEKACQALDLSIVGKGETILPNSEGWDGGFAVALRKLS